MHPAADVNVDIVQTRSLPANGSVINLAVPALTIADESKQLQWSCPVCTFKNEANTLEVLKVSPHFQHF